MADDERSNDTNLWFFLLGLLTGVLLAGGGTFTFFQARHARMAAEARALRQAAEDEAAVAQEALAEAEAARKKAEDARKKLEKK